MKVLMILFLFILFGCKDEMTTTPNGIIMKNVTLIELNGKTFLMRTRISSSPAEYTEPVTVTGDTNFSVDAKKSYVTVYLRALDDEWYQQDFRFELRSDKMVSTLNWHSNKDWHSMTVQL